MTAGSKIVTGTPVRTAPPGRTCKTPGCGARLSVYNRAAVCGPCRYQARELTGGTGR